MLFNFQKRIEMRIRLGDLEDSDEEDAKVERTNQFRFNAGANFAAFRGSGGKRKTKGPMKIKKNNEFSVGKSPRSVSADATKNE
jgi:hypothetical protein